MNTVQQLPALGTAEGFTGANSLGWPVALGVLPGQCGRKPRQWREAAQMGPNATANGPHAQPSVPGCSPAGARGWRFIPHRGPRCLHRARRPRSLVESSPGPQSLNSPRPENTEMPWKPGAFHFPLGVPHSACSVGAQLRPCWMNNEFEDPVCRLPRPVPPRRTSCHDARVLYLPCSPWRGSRVQPLSARGDASATELGTQCVQ